MTRWFTRGTRWLVIAAAGGGMFVLDGCDPTVRDTVLGGVESASTGIVSTFIQAFFETLATNGEDQTVMNTLETATQFFA